MHQSFRHHWLACVGRRQLSLPSSILPRHFAASPSLCNIARRPEHRDIERRHCNGRKMPGALHSEAAALLSPSPLSLSWLHLHPRTMLGHEMIQPQVPSTRSNTASDNRNTDQLTECVNRHLSFALLHCSQPFANQALLFKVLTSFVLCGRIKVKVGCGRIKKLPLLTSAPLGSCYSYVYYSAGQEKGDRVAAATSFVKLLFAGRGWGLSHVTWATFKFYSLSP
jgi:hypothetical protein